MQQIGAFEIIGIRDAGVLDKERILLRALELVKLEYYIIVNVKTTSENKLNVLNDKVFWFPVRTVNSGDFIRLYTKSGSYNREEANYGSEPAIFHNFFWGLDAPVWDGIKANAATIFKISDWNTAYRT
jgi:hypothetical protein